MLLAWYYSIPAVTRWLFTGMSILFIFTIFARDPATYCLSPTSFGRDNLIHSFVTLFTSTYTHLSFFHIFWNMSVWVYYGGVYERKWGSAKFALNVLLAGLACNLIHLVVAGIISYIPFLPLSWGYDLFVRTCSLGVSGVLFFFISVDCFDPDLPANSGQQIFGLMPVPKKYYPWIMLVLMQLMIKNVSFLGHLSGLLLGLMYARDRQRILHIKKGWIESIESTYICSNYLEPRAMWVTKNQLPGAVLPSSISFSDALQQQFKSFYGLNPNQAAAGQQAAPVPLNSGGFAASDPSSSGPPSSGGHAPTSAVPKFPGSGNVLGR